MKVYFTALATTDGSSDGALTHLLMVPVDLATGKVSAERLYLRHFEARPPNPLFADRPSCEAFGAPVEGTFTADEWQRAIAEFVHRTGGENGNLVMAGTTPLFAVSTLKNLFATSVYRVNVADFAFDTDSLFLATVDATSQRKLLKSPEGAVMVFGVANAVALALRNWCVARAMLRMATQEAETDVKLNVSDPSTPPQYTGDSDVLRQCFAWADGGQAG